MQELTFEQMEEVNGGIVPAIIAIVTNPTVQLAAKTVLGTAVAVVVGSTVYDAVRDEGE